MKKIAIYAGSFDPITLGHLDLIKRATRLFDKVIVAIGDNPKKNYMFVKQDRMNLTKLAIKDELTLEESKQVKVSDFDGLLVTFAKSNSAVTLIRGIRTGSDLEDELAIVFANRRIDRSVETIFMTPNEEYSFVSSSITKELLNSGANSDTLEQYVPKQISDYMLACKRE